MPHSTFTHVCLRSPGCAPWEAAGQRLQGQRNGMVTPGQWHNAEFASQPDQRRRGLEGLAGGFLIGRCRSQRGAPTLRPGSGCARRRTGFWQRPEPSVEHEVMSAPYPCLEACPSRARGEETCPKGAERGGLRGKPPPWLPPCHAVPCHAMCAMPCRAILHFTPTQLHHAPGLAEGLLKLPVVCDPTGLNISVLSCRFVVIFAPKIAWFLFFFFFLEFPLN